MTLELNGDTATFTDEQYSQALYVLPFAGGNELVDRHKFLDDLTAAYLFPYLT